MAPDFSVDRLFSVRVPGKLAAEAFAAGSHTIISVDILTLSSGDEIRITIEPVGTLVNQVS